MLRIIGDTHKYNVWTKCRVYDCYSRLYIPYTVTFGGLILIKVTLCNIHVVFLQRVHHPFSVSTISGYLIPQTFLGRKNTAALRDVGLSSLTAFYLSFNSPNTAHKRMECKSKTCIVFIIHITLPIIDGKLSDNYVNLSRS